MTEKQKRTLMAMIEDLVNETKADAKGLGDGGSTRLLDEVFFFIQELGDTPEPLSAAAERQRGTEKI